MPPVIAIQDSHLNIAPRPLGFLRGDDESSDGHTGDRTSSAADWDETRVSARKSAGRASSPARSSDSSSSERVAPVVARPWNNAMVVDNEACSMASDDGSDTKSVCSGPPVSFYP